MSTFRSFLSLAHTHTHAVAVCGFYLALCGIMRLCQCEIIQVRQLWPLFSVFRSTKLLLIAFGFAFKPLLCFFFQLSLPLLFSGLTHSLRYCVDAGKRENLLSQVNATLCCCCFCFFSWDLSPLPADLRFPCCFVPFVSDNSVGCCCPC